MNMLKLKDEVDKWKKEAEKASIRAKAPPPTASEREKELQSEIDKFMVRRVAKIFSPKGTNLLSINRKCLSVPLAMVRCEIL